MSSCWIKFRETLRDFSRANRGNVALTFALATLPIIGGVGAAVDYSHANAVKAAMQSALDSTALMLSHDAASLTGSQLQTKALSYFSALFTRPEAKNIKINASYDSNGGSSLLVTGSADVPTNLITILGYKQIAVTGSATAKWGTSRLRVALVLDNTGSMSADGKIGALKTATKNLLSQLQSAATTDGDVYVSIIPFSKDVNIGDGNYNSNYIDWTDWDSNNGTCKNYSSWSQPSNKSSCQNASGSWKSAKHNTWNGCITDRGSSSVPDSNNYDQKITAPTGSAASKFPAEQYDYCTVEMMGLNYDWTTMNSLVNSMQPNGSTNQPVGLVWGWQSLVGGGPLTAPAMDANYTYSQVIILLSDGLNTQDRWYGNGSDVSTPVDKRMYDSSNNGVGTCANIKAAGITIYSIQVNTGGDPTSTLLQNCASSSDKFFVLTSASQIVTTFNEIGTNLSKLYVAK